MRKTFVEKITSSFLFSHDKRVARVKALLSSVPEGQELLELAERMNVRFRFNPFLVFQGTMARIGNTRPRLGERPEVEFSPFNRTTGLAVSLAHELRHLWQAQQIDAPGNIGRLTFEKGVAYKRFMEADAFVFEKYMAAKMREATGLPIPWSGTPDLGLVGEMLGQGGAPPEDATKASGLKKLFDTFQQSLTAESYDRSVTAIFKKAADYFRGTASRSVTTEELQDKLKLEFNRASFKEVGDLASVAVIGKGKEAIRYLGEFDTDAMLDGIWQKARNPTLQKARADYALS